jgi:hypothetical protein
LGGKRCLYGSLIILLLFSITSVRAEEPEEGYDENTEVTIKGTVKDLVREMRGPLIFRIPYRDRVYHVVTAPPWYLRQQNFVFQSGLELEVTGSRYVRMDGTLYLVARKIKEVKTGREILFRDLRLRPCWRGMRSPRNMDVR